MPRIARRLEFDYGHRVLGHEGKCAHIHGHRGVAIITVQTPKLDKLSRVVDFGVVKKLVGGWIDENWDHNFLCHQDDPLLKTLAIADQQATRYTVEGRSQAPHPVSDAVWNGKKPFVFPNKLNPTAEVMAEYLFNKAIDLLQVIPDLTVGKVRLFETPNAYADWW